MSAAASSIDQHNIEIQKNREVWQRKPMLRSVYHGFHRLIGSRIDPSASGLIVELGSGMGAIKEVIPTCITTDLFPNPWLDRRENAYQLSFTDRSVSHLILFDVWHHLRYPGTALNEFRRVLKPGGRLILCEPAASWLGRIVYHYFHHEPVAVGTEIIWDAPADFKATDADYFAAQGSATRLFWWGYASKHLEGWKVVEVLPLASFEYFATGGFSGPQLGGRFLRALMRGLDWLCRPFPRLFAARLLVVLERS